MERIFQILLFFFLFCFSCSEAFSCTCIVSPLSKRFKKAEAVFIGKIAKDIPQNKAEIQNAKDGLPVLEVVKVWKGIKKEFVAIEFADFPKSSGTCPILYRFEEDKEYLVFAYGKGLKVEVECSDTRPLKAEYLDYTGREISKLNNFWFRFWTKVNPF